MRHGATRAVSPGKARGAQGPYRGPRDDIADRGGTAPHGLEPCGHSAPTLRESRSESINRAHVKEFAPRSGHDAPSVPSCHDCGPCMGSIHKRITSGKLE